MSCPNHSPPCRWWRTPRTATTLTLTLLTKITKLCTHPSQLWALWTTCQRITIKITIIRAKDRHRWFNNSNRRCNQHSYRMESLIANLNTHPTPREAIIIILVVDVAMVLLALIVTLSAATLVAVRTINSLLQQLCHLDRIMVAAPNKLQQTSRLLAIHVTPQSHRVP